ncbi:hypothetical protein PABG_12467 [Paracoccidioides brasiliensis Pb03]|nr:hypothetical protein PABG_12467 [Paracoccidioides brasiliensis Pb03]
MLRSPKRQGNATRRAGRWDAESTLYSYPARGSNTVSEEVGSGMFVMFPPELPGPDLRKICSAWIESRADHQLLATPARARGANISSRPLLDLIKIAFEPIVHDICDWDKETVTGILEEMHFNFRSSYVLHRLSEMNKVFEN